MSTRERLAKAVGECNNDGRLDTFIARIKAGEFDEFASPHDLPITTLVGVCNSYGLDAIAKRAIGGEFDATDAEMAAWEASAEGQRLINEISGPSNPLAKVFDLLKNFR